MILCSFPSICRLSWACISRETSTKQLGMLTYLWLSPSVDHPSPGLLSQADWSLLPCPLNCSLCLLSDLPSLLQFRSRGRSRPLSFVWVSRQNRPRDRLIGANTNGKELLRIVSHMCVCIIFFVPRSSALRKVFELVKLWISRNENYQVHSGRCLVLLRVS